MISICIPIYNFDVRELVQDLISQVDNDIEIILIDDASTNNSIKQVNRDLIEDRVVFIELEENIGRSRIRNLFLKYAKNEFLLFLDCDSKIINNQYVKLYKNKLKPSTQLVCGGRVYDTICPSESQTLRWKYGISRESKTADERKQQPNKSFMTNNFLINRNLFIDNPFDERLTQYGHEDTLLGIELDKKGVKIDHVENPILNIDIETNEVFMIKTEQAIDNLIDIVGFYSDKNALIESISLLKIIQKIEQFRLKWIFRLFYKLFGKMVRKNLIVSKNPSISMFGFYKVLYYTNRHIKN